VVDGDTWWAAFHLQVAAVLEELGCSDHEERGLLAELRTTYTDGDAFVLLPEARAVLDALAERVGDSSSCPTTCRVMRPWRRLRC
jgi:hypothetical protein